MISGDRRIDKGFRLPATTESRVGGQLGRLSVEAICPIKGGDERQW